MRLAKKQLQKFCMFLYVLVDDDVDILEIKFMGSAIIILREPVKGEIENRGWRVTQEGELEPIASFFYD